MSKDGQPFKGISRQRCRVMVLVAFASGALVMRAVDRADISLVPAPGGPTPSSATPATPKPPHARAALHGRVVQVLDGDSLVVQIDGAEQQVRLQGIDCPERGQPFANKARQLTRGLALNKQVAIESVGRDRYDRILGHPRLPDGSRLDYELVRSGMAWWYRHYSDDPELGELEAAARRDRRGLWADPNPVPPWEWRRRLREE